METYRYEVVRFDGSGGPGHIADLGEVELKYRPLIGEHVSIKGKYLEIAHITHNSKGDLILTFNIQDD